MCGNELNFYPWTKIPNLHNLLRDIDQEKLPAYRAKVKLHGTNAAIVIEPNGNVYAQSRKRVLNLGEQDNYNFAAWVKENEHSFSKLSAPSWATFNDVVIYGEWCGRGINSGDACSTMDRFFAIFAAYMPIVNEMIVAPVGLLNWLGEGLPQTGTVILPWHNGAVYSANTEAGLDIINREVDLIGARDPFIYDWQEVDGPGEGLVLYPDTLGFGRVAREYISKYIFKAKAERHRETKRKAPAQIDPQLNADVSQFVENTVTAQRLEKIFNGIDRPSMSDTGTFLQAVANDILDECKAEMDVANLVKKDVTKSISNAAVAWWKRKLNGH